jgi:hydroxymethylglutaryl-CoA reductase
MLGTTDDLPHDTMADFHPLPADEQGAFDLHSGNITAGAEITAAAGQYDGAASRQITQLPEDFVECEQHLPGKRIARLWVVESDDRDGVTMLELDHFIHAETSAAQRRLQLRQFPGAQTALADHALQQLLTRGNIPD